MQFYFKIKALNKLIEFYKIHFKYRLFFIKLPPNLIVLFNDRLHLRIIQFF